ncbi:MAG: hypothetical protein DDT29_02363 [Dehalococcoidia bacterium]|nr:hypothetical protein [Bacillota bacterium]
MKLLSRHSETEYSIELTAVEFGAVRMDVSEVKGGVIGHAVLDQVAALSLARLIEEMVKDIRRR